MKFTHEEVLELRKNPNVVKCSQKAVTYSKDFKLRAVKQYLEESLSCTEIFRIAGFNLSVLGRARTGTPNLLITLVSNIEYPSDLI